MPYIAVGITWVAGIVCSTVLVMHDHVWFGLLVLIVSALAGYRTAKE